MRRIYYFLFSLMFIFSFSGIMNHSAYATVSENDPYPYKPYLSWQEQYYSGVQSTIGVMNDTTLYMIKGQTCYVGKGAASFDKKVVKVGKDGVAKALKEGDSRLLITDYGSFDIKVIEPELSDTSVTMTVGAQKKLSLIWNNQSIEDMGLKVAWQSSNQNVIQVISGNCYAVGRGKAKVFATTGSIRYITSFDVADDSKTEYVMNTRLGKKRKIAVPYANKITWQVEQSESGNSICNVDRGKMIGRLVGDTTVSGNEGHSIKTYVEDPFTPIKTIWLDLGERRFISMNGIYEVPVWRSSKKTVASVSEYGVVIGERPGKTNITCRIQGKRTKIRIVVSNDKYIKSSIPDSEKHWNWVKVVDALNGYDGIGVWVSDDGDLKYELIPYYSYTVRFDSNGGSTVKSQTVARDGYAAVPEEPKKNGYIFKGWYLNGKLYDFSTPVNADITLKAEWEEVKYRITYELNGGKNNPSNPDGYSGEEDVSIHDPERPGYDFLGWTGSNGSTPEKNILIPAGSEGDRHYTAVWSVDPITYTITYNVGSGAISGHKTTYTVEDDTFTLVNPTHEYADFKGWTGSNGSSPETTVKVVKGTTGNLTYTAHWDMQPCNLIINRGDGSSIFGNVMIGDKVYTSSTTDFGVVEAGTSIKIIGTAGEHKSYSSENGGHDSEGAGLKYEYAVGFEFEMPDNPLTVTLYKYSSDNDYGIEINKGTVAISGLKNTTATVTFNCNGGTDNKGHSSFDVIVERGVAVIRPADPVRDGYTFDCWTTEKLNDNESVSDELRYDFDADVGHSIKLYAHWVN